MNIAGITSTDPTQIRALSPITSSAGGASGVDADGDHGGSRVGSSSVSPVGTLLGQLAQLQQTDAAKFKTVLTDIANKLQTTAQQDGGTQGQALSKLADKFQQAAQTGDLSLLKPPHHHHHGHHRGAAAYQQAAGSAGTGGSSPGTSAAPDARSQVLDIINQVISTDLGGTAQAA